MDLLSPYPDIERTLIPVIFHVFFLDLGLVKAFASFSKHRVSGGLRLQKNVNLLSFRFDQVSAL